jgi:hypothetical protein
MSGEEGVGVGALAPSDSVGPVGPPTPHPASRKPAESTGTWSDSGCPGIAGRLQTTTAARGQARPCKSGCARLVPPSFRQCRPSWPRTGRRGTHAAAGQGNLIILPVSPGEARATRHHGDPWILPASSPPPGTASYLLFVPTTHTVTTDLQMSLVM